MTTKLAELMAADPDLTFRLLAKLTGISKTALQEMAAGTKPIRPDQAEVIAQALDIEPSELE